MHIISNFFKPLKYVYLTVYFIVISKVFCDADSMVNAFVFFFAAFMVWFS